jgi:hypothetical protein
MAPGESEVFPRECLPLHFSDLAGDCPQILVSHAQFRHAIWIGNHQSAHLSTEVGNGSLQLGELFALLRGRTAFIDGAVEPLGLILHVFHGFRHGPDAARRKADLRLDTEAGARADLGGRQAVVPGQTAQSELLARVLEVEDPMSGRARRFESARTLDMALLAADGGQSIDSARLSRRRP